MSNPNGAAVVIIGGGVTGLSAGWWLARAGVDVLVLERGILGWEASGRNGGGATHVYSPFGLEEQRLWPQMDELLGYPTEYQPYRIGVALSEAQLALARRWAEIGEMRGFRWESLDRRQLKELVPIIGDNAIGGTYLHFGGHANPQRTVQAYAWAMQDHGGRILQHTTVTGLTMRGGRVTGVETTRGTFGADTVVVAAGPQTGLFADMLGVWLPLAPARVEMIATEPIPLMNCGGIGGNGLYGRQTLRGNLVYGGGPHEWINVPDMAAPEHPNTPLVRNLARRLAELFPGAAHVRLIRSWGGVVENTPDGLPVIDRLADPSNVIVATMSSVGFGLSPAVGRGISELVLHGRCLFADLSALAISRFADTPPDWRERAGWIAAGEPVVGAGAGDGGEREPMTRGIDARSIIGKGPRPERHVPLVVVGGGPAGVAAATEAARAGVEVLLVDENPVDNDMMAMDVPLYYGQRMQPSVRNRALMLERVVESDPALAEAAEAGVDVALATYVWSAFVGGPTAREIEAPLLGLADEHRSWLVAYDRLIVAAGARDVVLGFPGWERAGTMGASAAVSLLTRYRALAARRMVVIGSGRLGLRVAALALEHGVDVAAVVEVDARVRGDEPTARALAARGVKMLTSHTVRAARGQTGEVLSVVVVKVNPDGTPVAGSEREIACDTVCLAIGLTPSVELLALAGARLQFDSARGGWAPEIDAEMRTGAASVFAAGDCAGTHDGMLADADVARAQGRLAALAAAESLGALTRREAQARRAALPPAAAPADEVHGHWQAWHRSLLAAGGLDVNVCQCEEVTRRELIETRPPRYLGWKSKPMSARNLDTLLRDGPINQDQIKRLTRAGMGPCQSRRCREQVGLLLAHATGTPVERMPLPTFRPPIRPLPLSVLRDGDEPPAMREEWVSWFGIPTQFSPHWEAGMAIDEPTAHARLIVSDE